jgi:hypothetical protein
LQEIYFGIIIEGFKAGLANDYHLKHCILRLDSKTRVQEESNERAEPNHF